MVVATSKQPVALTAMTGRFIAFSVIRAVIAAPQPAHSLCPGPYSSSTWSCFNV